MRKLLALTAAAVLSVSVFAQELDEGDLAARIEAARQKLDEAAREFAELHRNAASGGFDVHYVGGERHDRPFLGILISRTDENGVTLGGVTPGGTAEEAGVKAGDRLIAVDGVSLTGLDAPLWRLNEVLDDAGAGQPIPLDLVRDGGVLTVDVVPQAPGALDFRRNFTRSVDIALPALSLTQPGVVGGSGVAAGRLIAAPGMMANRFLGGLQLVDIEAPLGGYFGVDEGVLVLHAGGHSELQPGDILQSIDDHAVNSAADAYRVMANLEEDGVVTVVRQQAIATFTVAPMRANGRYIRIERGGYDGEHPEDAHVMLDAP